MVLNSVRHQPGLIPLSRTAPVAVSFRGLTLGACPLMSSSFSFLLFFKERESLRRREEFRTVRTPFCDS